jgi:hypothetical protein
LMPALLSAFWHQNGWQSYLVPEGRGTAFQDGVSCLSRKHGGSADVFWAAETESSISWGIRRSLIHFVTEASSVSRCSGRESYLRLSAAAVEKKPPEIGGP